MRYLMILHAAALAMAATLGVVLLVVCLMYSVNLESSPSVARELPSLISATVTFCLLAIVLGIGFQGLLRQRSWRWTGEAVSLVALIGASAYLYNLFTV